MASSSSNPPSRILGSGPPPPGIIPNFSTPRDVTPFVLTAVLVPLTLLFVSMRLFTRFFLAYGFGWDDATCVMATVVGVVYAASRFVLVSLGQGLDLWNIPLGEFDRMAWARWTYVDDIAYSFVMGSIKISILLLYSRLFQVRSAVRWCIVSTIIYIILYTLIGDLVTILACKPLDFLWNGLPHGKCLNVSAVGIALASLQITADVFVLAIPIPVVCMMQLPRKQKIGVIITFGAGILVTIASCGRLWSLVQSLHDPKAKLNFTNTLGFTIWSDVEMYLAIMVSCFPTCKTFFKWLRSLPSRRSRYSTTSASPDRHLPSHRQKPSQSFSDTSGGISQPSSATDLGNEVEKWESGVDYPNLNRFLIPDPYLEIRRSGLWSLPTSYV